MYLILESAAHLRLHSDPLDVLTADPMSIMKLLAIRRRSPRIRQLEDLRRQFNLRRFQRVLQDGPIISVMKNETNVSTVAAMICN
jgi:hypothetical protein